MSTECCGARHHVRIPDRDPKSPPNGLAPGRVAYTAARSSDQCAGKGVWTLDLESRNQDDGELGFRAIGSPADRRRRLTTGN